VGRIVEPDIAMARPHQTRIATAVYTASNPGRDVIQLRIELDPEADLLMSVEVDHASVGCDAGATVAALVAQRGLLEG
jgi:hypothetical protein